MPGLRTLHDCLSNVLQRSLEVGFDFKACKQLVFESSPHKLYLKPLVLACILFVLIETFECLEAS